MLWTWGMYQSVFIKQADNICVLAIDITVQKKKRKRRAKKEEKMTQRNNVQQFGDYYECLIETSMAFT